jgi:hypothetical protein
MPTSNLRTMSWATFTNTIGSGLWLAAQGRYFTSIVGMPAVQMGAAITIANLAWLGVSIRSAGSPTGRRPLDRARRAVRAGRVRDSGDGTAHGTETGGGG